VDEANGIGASKGAGREQERGIELTRTGLQKGKRAAPAIDMAADEGND
jgi:hypothetical protein